MLSEKVAKIVLQMTLRRVQKTKKRKTSTSHNIRHHLLSSITKINDPPEHCAAIVKLRRTSYASDEMSCPLCHSTAQFAISVEKRYLCLTWVRIKSNHSSI